jgi:hypothetical protein
MADQFHGAKANNCSGVSAMMEAVINAFFRRKIQKPEEIAVKNQILHFDFDMPDRESKLLILVKDLDKDFDDDITQWVETSDT